MIKFLTFIFCVSSIWAVPHKIYPRSIGGASISITTPTGNFFCGGSVLNNNWVLTAGQCVNGATLFTIRLGTTGLQDDDTSLTLITETYVLHEDFNPNTLENDIGAIKFRSYITWTDYIGSVSLVSTTLPDSSIVLTLGWGQTSDDDPGLADSLNYIFLTTLSNVECRIYYGSAITDNMVCVAGSFNEGTCIGDSGSPLIQYSASQTYQVGISSFFSGNGCESIEPSGYTRISAYREWIRNVTGS